MHAQIGLPRRRHRSAGNNVVRVGGKLVAMGWRRVEWKKWKSCLGGESESESDWLGRSATRGDAVKERTQTIGSTREMWGRRMT